MNVGNELHVAVYCSPSEAVAPGTEVSLKALTPSVTFRLMRLEATDLYFYECTEPGCKGAGCPTFRSDAKTVPQEIEDHLVAHANLRHCPKH